MEWAFVLSVAVIESRKDPTAKAVGPDSAVEVSIVDELRCGWVRKYFRNDLEEGAVLALAGCTEARLLV